MYHIHDKVLSEEKTGYKTDELVEAVRHLYKQPKQECSEGL